MTIKINYSKTIANKSSGNQIIFSKDKFNTQHLKKFLSNSEFSFVNDLLKTSDLKKNLLIFDLNSKKKVILISVKSDLKISDIENLGAKLFNKINHGKNIEYNVISDSINSKNQNFLWHFLHGLKLKSYEFKKYKTKKDTRVISINVIGSKNKPSIQTQL